MIIVEGPDNVGKTTLVSQLLTLDPRLTVVKRRRFKIKDGQTIASSYFDSLLEAEKLGESGYAVIDRLLASECIYGDLFRGGCRMTNNDHFMIRAILVSQKAIIIHCDAPDDVIIASWKDREQLYDDPLVIARAYRERIQSIFPDNLVVRYDWTASDAEMKRQYITEIHRARYEEVKALRKLRGTT